MANRQRMQRVVKDSTCTLENGLTVLAERKQLTHEYYDNMPLKKLMYFEGITRKSIDKKRALLGLPTEEPHTETAPVTYTYFTRMWDALKELSEDQAKSYIQKGYKVFALDSNGITYSVSFKGLELTLNMEE